MATLRSISIYEAPPVAEPVKDPSATAQQQRAKRKSKEEQLVDSTLPSILIKNIAYNILPIEDSDRLEGKEKPKQSLGPRGGSRPDIAKYRLHVQLPIPITVFVRGKGLINRGVGDSISMIGFYFSTRRNFTRQPSAWFAYDGNSPPSRAASGTLTNKSIESQWFPPRVPTTCNHYVADEIAELKLEGLVAAVRFENAADALRKIKIFQAIQETRTAAYDRITLPTAQRVHLAGLKLAGVKLPPQLPPNPYTGDKIAETISKIINIPNTAIDSESAIGRVFSSSLGRLYVRLAFDSSVDPGRLLSERETSSQRAEAREIAHRDRSVANLKAGWLENIARREFAKNFASLSKAEQDIVESAYVRESAYVKNLIANKCPHVRLVRRVMMSREIGVDQNLWAELQAYLPKAGESSSMLACVRCGLPIICPHHRALFDMGETVDIEAIVAAFGRAQVDTTTTEYCKICGETLRQLVAESESWQSILKHAGESSMDDNTWQMIIAEVGQTINTNIDLKKSDLSRSGLVSAIAGAINSYVRRYELKLTRIKTNTEIIIAFSLHLIIAIYTLMMIVHLTIVTESAIGLRDTETGSNTGMKLLHLLFNRVYKLIVEQRASIIEKIPAFTPDRIKKIMTRAYKQVSGAPVTIETGIATKYKSDLITDNPIYRLLSYGRQVGALMADGKNAPRDIKSVLGVDYDKLENLSYFYAKAPLPDKWPTKDPFYVYIWDTFAVLVGRLVNDNFEHAPNLIAELQKESAINRAKRTKLMATSNQGRNILRTINPGHKFFYFARDNNISKVFCPNGREHKWDVYIFSRPSDSDMVSDSATMELKRGEKLLGGDLVGKRCILCNARLGELKADAVIKETTKSIEEAILRRNFMIYFMIKCPEGFMHNWADGVCSQCGLNRKTGVDDAYYTKYIENFLEVSRQLADKSEMVIDKIQPPKAKPPAKLAPWISKNDSIMAASELLGIPYNLLINIGLLRDVVADTVINGRANPSNSATDRQWFHQANVACAYVASFATTWNRFITCDTTGLPADLEELCSTQDTAVRAFKPINLAEFYAERELREKEKPKLYANWAVGQMCQTLADIHARGGSITRRFVEIAGESIVESERNMSKPLVYKNTVAAALSKMASLEDGEGGPIETDESAKDYITSALDSGDAGMGIDDIDVTDMAASFGDDDI